jgi:hypothetical protein
VRTVDEHVAAALALAPAPVPVELPLREALGNVTAAPVGFGALQALKLHLGLRQARTHEFHCRRSGRTVSRLLGLGLVFQLLDARPDLSHAGAQLLFGILPILHVRPGFVLSWCAKFIHGSRRPAADS